jgi:hypothetical protein
LILTIFTTDLDDTGVYTIEITIEDSISGETAVNTFELTVSCVQTITQTSTIDPVVYYIRDTPTDVVFPTYTISPSGCPYEIVI